MGRSLARPTDKGKEMYKCRGSKTGDVSRLARMRFVVRHAGFEPATHRLKVGYSTTELMALIGGKRGRCGKRMEGHFSHPFYKIFSRFPVVRHAGIEPATS